MLKNLLKRRTEPEEKSHQLGDRKSFFDNLFKSNFERRENEKCNFGPTRFGDGSFRGDVILRKRQCTTGSAITVVASKELKRRPQSIVSSTSIFEEYLL